MANEKFELLVPQVAQIFQILQNDQKLKHMVINESKVQILIVLNA